MEFTGLKFFAVKLPAKLLTRGNGYAKISSVAVRKLGI